WIRCPKHSSRGGNNDRAWNRIRIEDHVMDRHIGEVAADVRPPAAVIRRQKYVLARARRAAQRKSLIANAHRLRITRIHRHVNKLSAVNARTTEHAEVRKAARAVLDQHVPGGGNTIVPQTHPQAWRAGGGDLRYAVRKGINQNIIAVELRP